MREKLKNLAVIRAGYQFRGRVQHDPNGKVRVLQIRDFTEDRTLRLDDLVRVNLPAEATASEVKSGDVLFLSRGHKLWATTIEADLPSAVASGYFFIVRPHPTVRPRYLAWYMGQSEFQSALRPVHRGSHIPLVSRVDFEELEIEVPPVEVQDRIVALDGLAKREQSLIRTIAEKRASLVVTACMIAAHGRQVRKEGRRT